MALCLRDSASVHLSLDKCFTGIMHGYPDDESDGCTVKGECEVRVYSPIKVRRLVVRLEGRCKVYLQSSTSRSLGSTEGTQTRTLCCWDNQYLGTDGHVETLSRGTYHYPFEFYLASNLPASFHGKRGYVRYHVSSTIYRANMFSNDIHANLEVPIKRNLVSDLGPIPNLLNTVHSEDYSHALKQFSITSPSITFVEGGLVTADVIAQVAKPSQRVQMITCALRERYQYRTTSYRGKTVRNKSDDYYPLGHRSQTTEDPSDARCAFDFRLIPRVHADTSCKLLRVEHALVVTVFVRDTEHREHTEIPTMTSNQEANHHFADDNSPDDSGDEKIDHPPSSTTHSASHTIQWTTPPITPITSPPLSRSSSSSSLTSLFSLRRLSIHHDEDVPIKQAIQRRNSADLILCTHEVPIVITSRDVTWWSPLHKPPSYNSTTILPSYQNVSQLSPVPGYEEQVLSTP